MSNRRRLMLRQEAAGSFDPSDLASLYAWYDASDASTFTLGAGDGIDQWRDKSGGGYHLTPSSTSSTNIARDGTQNGLATVEVKVTNVSIDAALAADWTWITGGASMHLELVMRWETVADPNAIYYACGTGLATGGNRGFNLIVDDRSSVPRSNVVLSQMNSTGTLRTLASADNAITSNTYVRVTLQIDADTNPQIAEVDGVEVINTSPSALTTTAAATTPFALGNLGTGTSANNFRNGAFAECVICDAALSSGDKAALASYLDTKWGL